MPTKDPDKRREHRRKWYERNTSYVRQRIVERKARLRLWMKNYKADLVCVKCGEAHPACLDFHHTNPDVKEVSIGTVAAKGWGQARILREMAKCQVLCANCHRKLHSD